MRLRLLCCLCLVAFCPSGLAKTFQTSYLQVELPDTWTCQQLEAEWACRPTDNQYLHTATLIFSAKEIAPEDTFTSIESQLKTPRTITSASGRGPVTSKLNWIRSVELGGTRWLEALHTNSELEGYFTYYLATVTPRLTILLNFTFQNTQAKFYQPILEELRKSVTLNRLALEAAPSAEATRPQGAATLPAVDSSVASGSSSPMDDQRKYLILLVIVAVALVFYFATRRRRR